MLLQSTATNNCFSFNFQKILKYKTIFQILSIIYVPTKNTFESQYKFLYRDNIVFVRIGDN